VAAFGAAGSGVSDFFSAILSQTYVMTFVIFVRHRSCNCEIEFLRLIRLLLWAFVNVGSESNRTYACEMNISICETICEVSIVYYS
jgi:hypothetical protein